MKSALIFACLLAACMAASLSGGNVLSTMNGDTKNWGKWIPDLIFIILSPIGMFWCSLMGFLGGLGGDNLIAFQKCWAGWFTTFY